ncbi:MAG TPA: MBL fold metallo-hydrolase, partial [Gaiellaceae bacterium]
VLHAGDSDTGRTRLGDMVLSVDCFVLDPRYSENCWVIHTHENPWAIVVDPGGDPALLGAEGVETAAILVTHTDVDHISGVAELAELSGADVWAPAGEADALRTGETRGGFTVRAHEPDHLVQGGDTIDIAGLELDVVDVPGHTSGHVAYHVDGKLFSGDVLFAGSVGRVDMPGGDWQSLVDSIRMLVERFGPDTEVYPGHGPITTLGRELESNPFLHELRSAER